MNPAATEPVKPSRSRRIPLAGRRLKNDDDHQKPSLEWQVVAPMRRQQRLLAATHVQKPFRKRICRLMLSVAAVGVVALESVVWTSHFNS